MKKISILKLHCILLISIFISNEIKAQEQNEQFFLPQVNVVELKEKKKADSFEIKSKTLEKMPLKTQSVSEAVKLSPFTRSSNDENSSLDMGEILPAKFSISGGKFYDNNINLDGMRIESWFDPAFLHTDSISDMPGFQTFLFPNIETLEKVEIFENNIPAQYGGFSGGVVNAVSKKPSSTFKGFTQFYTTRSEWTKYHLKDPLKTDFENSHNQSLQPKFKKYDSSLFIEGPLNDKAGASLSFKNIYLEIPLYHLDKTKNQTRNLSEISLNTNIDNFIGKNLKIGFINSPYTAKYFSTDAINSDYTIEKNTYSLYAKSKFYLKNSDLDITTAFSKSRYERDAKQCWYKWDLTPSKNWGSLADDDVSKEGGFGDIVKKETSVNLNADIDFYTKKIGKNIYIKPSAGIFVYHLKGSEERPENTYIYTSAKTKDPYFINPDNASVYGEQYFTKRLNYHNYYGEESINYYGFYAQNTITVNRLKLRPGLRISKDDFLDNINISPRFTLSYEILKNKMSVYAGYNKYYSHGFLQQKLQEARKAPYTIEYREIENSYLTEWKTDPRSPKKIYQFSDLKTPYADEYSTGIKLNFFNTDFKIDYIKKFYKDQFTTDFGVNEGEYKIFRYNNCGKSKYQGLSFSAKKEMKNFGAIFNISWQKTLSFFNDYNSDAEEETQYELVFYENKIKMRKDLPASDYNRPIEANLILWHTFSDITDISVFIKYKGHYDVITKTGSVKPGSQISPYTGKLIEERIPLYENIQKDAKLTCDIKVQCRAFHFKRYTGKLILQVENIFDSVQTTYQKTSIPEYGRRFYAGIKFEF